MDRANEVDFRILLRCVFECGDPADPEGISQICQQCLRRLRSGSHEVRSIYFQAIVAFARRMEKYGTVEELTALLNVASTKFDMPDDLVALSETGGTGGDLGTDLVDTVRFCAEFASGAAQQFYVDVYLIITTGSSSASPLERPPPGWRSSSYFHDDDAPYYPPIGWSE
jgi:hypothetical protein